LPDYYDDFDATAWVAKGTLPTNADVMAYEGLIDAPLFPPGDQYLYSNPAYEALPLVIEAVSGQDFATFMKEHVFKPAAMSDSLIHDHNRPHINRRVLGYSEVSGGYELNDDDPLNGITGSGGQYSTLEDFFNWDQALYADTLVSKNTMKQVFTRARLNNGEEIDYGFGWRLDSYKGHDRVAHGGSWVGFRTAISRYPDSELTIVVLSNLASYDPVAVSDQVTDIYLDQEQAP
jgi:CubicO group peptidase (beta-lactamase class C family)